MAKKSNNDLLGEILEELESIRVDQEKNGNKGDKDGVIAKLFNGPAADKEKKGSDKQTMTVLNSLKMIIDAVKGVSKVSTKDVDHVKNVVSSLSSVLNDIKFDKEQVESFQKFADTMQKLNTMMETLNGNLLKTIWKFNKVRGRILGKHVAGFYAAFFQAFEDAKVFTKISNMSKASVDSFVKINEQITKLFSLNAKTVRRLGRAFKNFPPEAIENICSFLTAILDTIKKYPSGKKEFKERIDNFVGVMAAMATVPFMQLWMMGLLLDPKKAERIGKYFTSLVDTINKMKKDQVENAAKLMVAVAILIGVMALSLLTVVIIARKFKATEILGGFAILATLILLSVGTMWLLGHISFKDEKGKVNAKDAMIQAGVVALLLLTLSLSLAITTSIAKKYKPGEILKGLAVLVALVAISLGIMWVMSRKGVKEMGKDSIWTGIAMVAMGLIMIELALIFKWAAPYWDDILIGGATMLAVLAGGIGILWLAGQVDDTTALKGLLAIALISAGLLAITFAVSYYMDLMDKIAGISGEDIAIGSVVVLAIIAATTAAIFAASLCLSGPQAGFFALGLAAVASISLALLGISAAVGSFVDLLVKIKSLSQDDMDHAFNLITGDMGMTNCISKMVTALTSIDGIEKGRKIAKNLDPLFKSIGRFMKIIENMANLKYIESYDEKGNPKYAKMPADVFITSANTLATGFSQFITTLGEAFGDEAGAKNLETVNKICQQLCPKNSALSFIFGGRKASVNDLLNVLGNFIGIIDKMANLRYIASYDDKGNPVYEKMPDGVFLKAAIVLSVGFATFINELANGFKNTSGQVEDIIDDLADGDTKDLFEILGQFVGVIEQMASKRYVKEYKEDGTPIYGVMDDEMFSAAATNLCDSFSLFLTTLHDKFRYTSGDIEDIIDDLGDGDTVDLFNAIGSFAGAIQKVGDLKIPIYDANGKVVGYEKVDIVKAGTNLSLAFCSFIKTLHHNLNGIIDDVEDIIDILGDDDDGLMSIFEGINAFLDPCIKIAQGEINGKAISIDDLKLTAEGIVDIVNKIVTGFPNQIMVKSLPKTTDLLEDATDTFEDIVKNIMDAINATKGRKMAEVGMEFSSFIFEMKLAIDTLNKADAINFKRQVNTLESSTSSIQKLMKKLNKISRFNSDDLLEDLGRIKEGVSAFLAEINQQHQIVLNPQVVEIDPEKEVAILRSIARKSEAFNSLQKSIRNTNREMARLVQLEKEWQKLSNESVFKNLAEMMKQQAEALNEAVKSFTEQVEGESTIRVQISPADIAQGIEQASWQYSKSSNGNSYVKI